MTDRNRWPDAEDDIIPYADDWPEREDGEDELEFGCCFPGQCCMPGYHLQFGAQMKAVAEQAAARRVHMNYSSEGKEDQATKAKERQRYIPAALEEITAKFDEVGKLTISLYDRVETVLLREEKDPEVVVQPIAGDIPLLARDLAGLRGQIENHIRLLEDLINRIEL